MKLGKAFEVYLVSHKVAEKTNKQRIAVMLDFIKHFGHDSEIEDLDTDGIKLYFQKMPVSFVTKNNRRRYLHAWINWLYIERLIDCNPIKFVRPQKPNREMGERYPHEVNRGLPREIIVKLINRSRSAPEKHLMILLILIETGCRAGEAIKILKKDIHENFFIARSTKNGQDNIYFYSEILGKRLKAYIETHYSRWAFPSHYDHNQHVTYDVINNYFRRYIAKDIVHPLTGGTISLHQIRHTVITSRAPFLTPAELMRLSGHKSFATTTMYINNSFDIKQNAYKKIEHLSFINPTLPINKSNNHLYENWALSTS